MKHVSGTKYKMSTLLIQIADLHPLFCKIFNQELSIQVQLKKNDLVLPSSVLDLYHMTPNRFEQYLENHSSSCYDRSKRIVEKENQVVIPLIHAPTSLSSSPWLIDGKGTIFLLKNRSLVNGHLLPELAIHYLILYNLSMISRYEAEWWGELFHTFDGTDLPFIIKYLEVAVLKIPHMITTFLNHES